MVFREENYFHEKQDYKNHSVFDYKMLRFEGDRRIRGSFPFRFHKNHIYFRLMIDVVYLL